MSTLWFRQGYKALGDMSLGQIAAVATLVLAASSLLFAQGTADIVGTVVVTRTTPPQHNSREARYPHSGVDRDGPPARYRVSPRIQVSCRLANWRVAARARRRGSARSLSRSRWGESWR